MQSSDPGAPFVQARIKLTAQVQAALAGRYRIERELGQGGMAIAYLAENLDFHRLVAIKVLRPDKGYEVGAVERFRTEAEAVAQLRHPHIICVHARGEEGDILWFEMDYIDGGSLEDKIGGRPLSASTTARYLGQAADALAYAHRQGIIHRDIKPSNLLISAGTDHVVVTDFGIAKIVGKTSVTETGVTVGTLAYMSPEQLAADRHLTAAADQYSLGVVAYQCLVGSLPYEGTSPGQFISAQVHQTVPPVLSKCTECPPDLAALIERMLAPDPDARWPDMLLVRQAAEEIATYSEAPVLRAAPKPRASRRRGHRSARTGLIAAASCAVLATGAIGWRLWPHQSSPIRPSPAAAAPVTSTPVTKSETQADSVATPAATQSSHAPAVQRRVKTMIATHTDPPRAGPAPRRDTIAPRSTVADTPRATGPPIVAPPPPPVPTTAVLSITSKLPGTFVYVGGEDKVYIVPMDHFINITVLPGKVHLRITSNQPGCKEREDDIVLTPGEHKNIQRNADCPNS
jgi:serine/threonine-protein kinase